MPIPLHSKQFVDKIAELGEQTDLPYGLVEELLKLLARKSINRCAGECMFNFICATPNETFLPVLEVIAFELRQVGWL